MPIISVGETKELLQIPKSEKSKDAAINLLIPIVEDFVKTYCQSEFKDSKGGDDFPIGIKLPVVQLIGYNLERRNIQGVKNESLADHSISFDTSGGYPTALLQGLDLFVVKKNNKIKWTI